MRYKISTKRCPKCNGILGSSSDQTECISCGYIENKKPRKKKRRSFDEK